MIEDKELGLKIVEDSDEAFWTEKKEQIEKADKGEARNAKIRAKMLELCKEELS